MHFLKKLASSVVMAAASIAASVAVAQTPSAADWDKVIAAAKQEGTLILYNAQAGWPEPLAAARAFEAKYGIKVNILEVRGSELMERVRMEGTANRVAGDVMLIGSTGTVPVARQGLLAPHGGLPNAANLTLKGWSVEEIPVLVINYGIAVNTNLVKAGDEPKSWKDLLDPKYKGRIIADQVAAPSGGSSWFAVMLEAFGQSYHEQMAKNEPHFDTNLTGKAQRVARGEFLFSIPFNMSELNNLKGLPVKGVIPQEGAPYTPVGASIIKGGPHPNAARLFLNFLIEPDTQLIFARSGYPITIKGIEDKVPPDMRGRVFGKLLGHADIDKQAERLKLAAQIYLKK
jgi:iron(III) transport system substrate-binding protein